MQYKLRNQSYKPKDIRILAKKVVYHGYCQMLQYRLQNLLFNGEWSAGIERELFEHGKVTGVLLYDAVLNKVVLIEQFGITAVNDFSLPWLLVLLPYNG